MTRQQKKQFVQQMIGQVQDHIISKLDEYPEDWDGIELRWLIAENFSRIVWGNHGKARKREYNNTVLTKDLI